MFDYLSTIDIILFLSAGLSTCFLQYINSKTGGMHLVTDVISILIGGLLGCVYLAILFVIYPWHVSAILFAILMGVWIITPLFIGTLIAIPSKFFVNIGLLIWLFMRLYTNVDWATIEISAGYVILSIIVIGVFYIIPTVLPSIAHFLRYLNRKDTIEDLTEDAFSDESFFSKSEKNYTQEEKDEFRKKMSGILKNVKESNEALRNFDFEETTEMYSKMLREASEKGRKKDSIAEKDLTTEEILDRLSEFEKQLEGFKKEGEDENLIKEFECELNLMKDRAKQEDLSRFWLSKTEIENSIDSNTIEIINKKLKNLHRKLSLKLHKSIFLQDLLLSDKEIEDSLDPKFCKILNEKIKDLYTILIEGEVNELVPSFSDNEYEDFLDVDIANAIIDKIENFYVYYINKNFDSP